jgi:hypothetical protein
MPGSDAYMALALCNAQGELSELEVGLHALGSGLSQTAYGEQLKLSQQSVAIRVNAARVAETTVTTRVVDPKLWRHLAELHPAPKWLWRSLVSRLVSEGWTVEQARGAAQRFKDTPEPPQDGRVARRHLRHGRGRDRAPADTAGQDRHCHPLPCDADSGIRKGRPARQSKAPRQPLALPASGPTPHMRANALHAAVPHTPVFTDVHELGP